MQVINGSTDITTYFVLRDSVTHAPKTDVTITDIDLYYVTYQAAISSKADATALAAADSAHSDNKAFNVGQGVYRVDWPDIWSGGVGKTVQLIVVCSGVDTTYLEVELTDPAQTGDSYARLGAPAGASVSADIADIEGKVDDLETRVTAARAGYLDNINNAALQTTVAQTGDAFARLGAPAGASVSADVAAIKAQADAIEVDTQDLQTQVGVDGAGLTAIGDARLANLDATISSRAKPGDTMIASQVTGSVLGDVQGYVLGSVSGNVIGSVLGSVASVTAGVTLADDAITSAKFDESTAYPLKSADTGATAVARTGADSDTLETLSDQLDGLPTTAQINAEVVDVLRTDTIPDSYASDGSQPTIAQALLAINQYLMERAVSGTTVTVKKPDGSTTAMTFTLDDGTNPTSITRAS